MVAQKLPSGTKTSPSSSKILLTSSGISSLDDVLGGGIQLGTSLLLLSPDLHSAHYDLVHKYYIAQGLASAQNVIVFDPSGQDLVESCMWTSGDLGMALDEEEIDGAQEKVKIAWRYERLQKFKTTVSSKSHDQYVSNLRVSPSPLILQLEMAIADLLIYRLEYRRLLLQLV